VVEDKIIVPEELRLFMLADEEREIVVPAEWRIVIVLEKASGQ
jgi:hypothetical protein